MLSDYYFYTDLLSTQVVVAVVVVVDAAIRFSNHSKIYRESILCSWTLQRLRCVVIYFKLTMFFFFQINYSFYVNRFDHECDKLLHRVQSASGCHLIGSIRFVTVSCKLQTWLQTINVNLIICDCLTRELKMMFSIFMYNCACPIKIYIYI